MKWDTIDIQKITSERSDNNKENKKKYWHNPLQPD